MNIKNNKYIVVPNSKNTRLFQKERPPPLILQDDIFEDDNYPVIEIEGEGIGRKELLDMIGNTMRPLVRNSLRKFIEY